MKKLGMPALLALGAVFALYADGDACWRRRCFAPGWSTRPCPTWTVVRPYDKRLETDKRDFPEFSEDAAPSGFPIPFAERAFREPDGDTFTVHKRNRGKAKTRFADAPLESFPDLRSLILSLPDDEVMWDLTQTDTNFDRIDVLIDGMRFTEKRNVRVVAFLFAIKKESDSDYHLIIDDDGFLEEGAKFNVEVSGIATEGPDIEALRQVRNSFKALFDGRPPTKYKPFINPPVRVEIEGSLFFDRDHKAGEVGPQGFRPGSAWEIHPVRHIRVLDN